MKKWMASGAIAVAALALSVVVNAQDKPAPKEHTMTGCLAKGTAPDTFIVTSTAEKGPKTIGIVSSKANLTPHVGHKIDITGVNVPAKEAESAKPAPPAADHYMSLSAIAMVAAKCP
jgi:hypothetical protein